ncbi:Gas vesicle synthesis protein GvpL/GvpF [Pelotomaculum schinkii]|uniref:Gas vesicle synthesis protein GvpL/GvpF n=1 Tax=Pelotomaculum schinkii TaxID=78350 RepID=A0A4Y7RDW7_9FIRM|nr:GvpL/GvpF family gas vesicle protein [Pelotomaculum schinkii]TEB07184.1 Gas vesicle synthesis protein GvpL/GvpF [Pelotomaculum schinkii]
MKISQGLYAYCIIQLEQERDLRAKLPADLFFISHRGIAVIVKKAAQASWQPTRKNILNHQKVVTQLQEIIDLLPLRFGTVFKNNNEAEKILDKNFDEINHLLSKIKGRIELGLKIFWKQDAFVKEIGDKKIETLKKEYGIRKKDRYAIAIEAGKIIEEKVLDKRDEYVRLIFKPLKKLADDSVLNPVTGEKMVFNAAFLVKSDHIEIFDQAVKDLYDKYQERFIFKYSGPWTPYNFVKVSW